MRRLDFAGKGGKGQAGEGKDFDDPTHPPPEGNRKGTGREPEGKGKKKTNPTEGRETLSRKA
jgi:hypothetical protein